MWRKPHQWNCGYYLGTPLHEDTWECSLHEDTWECPLHEDTRNALSTKTLGNTLSTKTLGNARHLGMPDTWEWCQTLGNGNIWYPLRPLVQSRTPSPPSPCLLLRTPSPHPQLGTPSPRLEMSSPQLESPFPSHKKETILQRYSGTYPKQRKLATSESCG